jgi:uncharacterized protein YggE
MRSSPAVLALALTACAGPAAAQEGRVLPPPTAAPVVLARTIRVSGEGRVMVKPDIARVTAGVADPWQPTTARAD